MSSSILQPDIGRKDKKCFITGATINIHKHHIFYGPNRKTSDKRGFWVWLSADLHNGNNPEAVHNNPNKGLDLYLKQECQRKHEERRSRNEFISLIGRSYL